MFANRRLRGWEMVVTNKERKPAAVN